MENAEFVSRMAGDWAKKKRIDWADQWGLFPTRITMPQKDIKKGFVDNIEKDTIKNRDYRKVLYTGHNTQLVLMSLLPGEQIGMEVHPDVDQFFRFESGQGMVIINGINHRVTNGSAVVVPAGAQHNVVNIGRTELKLYTLYSPPHHRDKVDFRTKKAAEASTETFTGQTTE